MRRKIKRKVFMMGMAVTATLPIGTAAKASGKPDYESHPYSGWRDVQMSVPAANADDVDPGKASLIGKLKNLLGGGGYGLGAGTAHSGAAYSGSAYSQGKGWQVELLQNQADTEQTGNIRQARDKRLGLAFRLSF